MFRRSDSPFEDNVSILIRTLKTSIMSGRKHKMDGGSEKRKKAKKDEDVDPYDGSTESGNDTASSDDSDDTGELFVRSMNVLHCYVLDRCYVHKGIMTLNVDREVLMPIEEAYMHILCMFEQVGRTCERLRVQWKNYSAMTKGYGQPTRERTSSRPCHTKRSAITKVGSGST